MPRSGGPPPEQEQESGIGQTLEEFEKLLVQLAQPRYVFRLFVSGNTPRSTAAIANVRRLCEQYLPSHYELEVIDIYQQPELTKQAQIIAVPTLIKEVPFPRQRFVGDMSCTERIVIGLNLRS
jgi:circadian clock protein KaiB